MTTLTQSSPRVQPIIHSHMSVAPGVHGLQTVMVNLFYIGDANGWVLVDAGLPMNGTRIISTAEALFGAGTRPNAIILTHGHFDHVGSLDAVLKHWRVPVYAHRLEIPYLTGQSDYPPPDPTVGGGMFARLSPLYPRHAYDFRPFIHELPEDGSVPGIEGWRWIHTPGHAPGHVSLFRDSDRAMIAGDAFTTQKQESFLAVMTNAKKIHGPPMYFTSDWISAKQSVQKLAELMPNSAVTGHGLPMYGDPLKSRLINLAQHFHALAMPSSGRYVDQPAVSDERGVVKVPPPVSDPFPKIVAGIAIAGIAAAIVKSMNDRDRM